MPLFFLFVHGIRSMWSELVVEPNPHCLGPASKPTQIFRKPASSEPSPTIILGCPHRIRGQELRRGLGWTSSALQQIQHHVHRGIMANFRLNHLCPRRVVTNPPTHLQLLVVSCKSLAVLKQIVNAPLGRPPTLVVSHAISMPNPRAVPWSV